MRSLALLFLFTATALAFPSRVEINGGHAATSCHGWMVPTTFDAAVETESWFFTVDADSAAAVAAGLIPVVANAGFATTFESNWAGEDAATTTTVATQIDILVDGNIISTTNGPGACATTNRSFASVTWTEVNCNIPVPTPSIAQWKDAFKAGATRCGPVEVEYRATFNTTTTCTTTGTPGHTSVMGEYFVPDFDVSFFTPTPDCTGGATAGCLLPYTDALDWSDFAMPTPNPRPISPSCDPAVTTCDPLSAEIAWGFRLPTFVSCDQGLLQYDGADAGMRPEASWSICADDPTLPGCGDLLSHEQSHLDLAEAGACRIRSQLDALDCVAAACDADIVRQAGQIIDDGLAEIRTRQARYEARTEHGTHAARQSTWTQRIDGWMALFCP